MFKLYTATTIVKARPAYGGGGGNRAGYLVHYEGGGAEWIPADEFEARYREVTHHERQLIEQTDAEAAVGEISADTIAPIELDDAPTDCEHKYEAIGPDLAKCTKCGLVVRCEHVFVSGPMTDRAYCKHCGSPLTPRLCTKHRYKLDPARDAHVCVYCGHEEPLQP